MRIVLVGGDKRMELAAGLLAGAGHQIRHLHSEGMDGWEQCLAEADALLLPYPVSVKDGKVPGWEHGGVKALLERLHPGKTVLAGSGIEGSDAEALTQGLGLTLQYYAEDTTFLQRNADISAEAAVYAAMQRSGRTLDEQRVLITGYGIFGRAIAWRLQGLGARVWVAARRATQRRQAAADGVQPIALEEIVRIAPEMDLVLNTIPAVILDREKLGCFPEQTIFLELASPPYGIDLAAAAELELNTTVLPGLPAWYAPCSAAAALKETVLRRIGEECI